MSLITRDSSLSISTGPSGRAIAQSMDPDLLDSFQQHLTMERNASVQYFAISLWFFERELRGFSQYFKNESNCELLHSQDFANYLIARGQVVLLDEIPRPNQEWNSPEEIIAFSFQMEADITLSLHQLYSIADRSGDMRTTVFLDPTIETQVSSEDEFAYLLGKVKFANGNSSAMLLIDDELSAKK